MPRFLPALTAVSALLPFNSALTLDVSSPDSIRNASRTLAYGLMSWYTNNQTTTPISAVGTLPSPLYWWEAGAVWGGMIDYWGYTSDTSYNPTITQALLAQTGPNDNFMPPAYFASLGNDDQAFWALASLSAAEYNFPTPSNRSSTFWLDLAEAAFDTMVPRWDTTECDGGLQWQIFRSNPGWGYKNSISNGGFFQMAARLAHYTGNQTYVDWSEKIWNWMENIGFIDQHFNVFDGAGSDSNCSQINRQLWSYNPSMLLYGAAILYNHTNDLGWALRTNGLMQSCANTFFSPYPNATNILYERACEPSNTCNNDQHSFKAYMSRWLAKASVVAPFIAPQVKSLLNASAQAAAQSCSGGENGTVCGQKWYVGGYDGSLGVGQQLSALETVQALLLLQGDLGVDERESGVLLRSGNATATNLTAPASLMRTAANLTTADATLATKGTNTTTTFASLTTFAADLVQSSAALTTTAADLTRASTQLEIVTETVMTTQVVFSTVEEIVTASPVNWGKHLHAHQRRRS